MIWRKPGFIFCIAMIACSLWASAAPFIKKGYMYFSITTTPSILVYAGLRFFLAGCLVLCFAKFRTVKPTSQKLNWKHVLILAFCQTAGQYFFYYIGLAHTCGVSGSIICGMGSFFALLMACLIFHSEKMTMQKLLGVLCGFVGIVWLNLGGDMGGTIFGNSFVLISQISSACSTCFINRFTQKEDPVLLSGSQFCVGGSILMGIGLALGGTFPHGAWQGYLVLLHLACVSAIAYTLWSLLLAHNPVSKIGIYNTMIPVLGVFLSALILGETKQAFSIRTWIALAFVSSGILVLNKIKSA